MTYFLSRCSRSGDVIILCLVQSPRSSVLRYRSIHGRYLHYTIATECYMYIFLSAYVVRTHKYLAFFNITYILLLFFFNIS